MNVEQKTSLELQGAKSIADYMGMSVRMLFYLLSSNNPPKVYRVGRGRGTLAADTESLDTYMRSRPRGVA